MMIKKLFVATTLAIFAATGVQAQYENTKMKVGEVAPEIAQASPTGKVISLKETTKGRYVLVDFWASWCGPCRRANPELVEFYKKYQNTKFENAPNGFTVFSVSLDRAKDAWVAAIAKDGLIWENHVSDLKYWQSEAAALYGVQFIPQAFLIGPDGKIVGKYLNVLEAAVDLEKFVAKAKTKTTPAKKASPTKSAKAAK